MKEVGWKGMESKHNRRKGDEGMGRNGMEWTDRKGEKAKEGMGMEGHEVSTEIRKQVEV